MDSLFDRVGGAPFFEALVRDFYTRVAGDALLRPLYPEDLEPSREWLTGFLVQYWGGPATYSEQRGHPRLRMRHAPFRIGSAERDAWWAHMSTAVRNSGASTDNQAALLDYFSRAADAMINS